MPQFLVNKLIRDKFSDLDHWKGTHVLSSKEFLHELKRKLIEEAEEVMATETQEDLLEELADVQDIIDTLVKHVGLTTAEITRAQSEKFEKRGGFEKRIFAKIIDLKDGDCLVDHCRSQPHKYKEI